MDKPISKAIMACKHEKQNRVVAMLRISPPSLQTVKDFLIRAVSESQQSKTLILVPGALMRDEVENFLLSHFSSIGGVEVLSLQTLTSRLAVNAEVTPDYLLLSAIVELLERRSETVLGAAFESRLEFAKALLRLFEIFEHSRMTIPRQNAVFSALSRDEVEKAEFLSLFAEYRQLIRELKYITKAESLSRASEYIRRIGVSWDRIYSVGFYSLTPAQAVFFRVLKGTVVVFDALLEVASEAFDLPELSKLPQKLRDFRLLSEYLGVFDENEIELQDFEDPKEVAIKYSCDSDTSHEALTSALFAKTLIDSGCKADDIAVIYPVESDFSLRVPDFLSRSNIPSFSVSGKTKLESPVWQLLEKVVQLLQSFPDPSLLFELLSSPCVGFNGGEEFPASENSKNPMDFSKAQKSPQISLSLINLIISDSRLSVCKHHLREWQESITSFSQLALASADSSGGQAEGCEMIRMGRIRFSAISLKIATESICGLLAALEKINASTVDELSLAIRALFTMDIFREIADALHEESEVFIRRMASCARSGRVRNNECAQIAFESIISSQEQHYVSDSVVVAPLLMGRQLLRDHVFLGGMGDNEFPFKSSFLPLFPELTDYPDLGTFNRLDESIHLYYLLTRRPSEIALSHSNFDGFSSLSPSFFYYFERNESRPNHLEFSSEERRILADVWDNPYLASNPVFSAAWCDDMEKVVAESGNLVNGIIGARANAMRTYVPFSEYSGDLSSSLYQEVAGEMQKLKRKYFSVSDIETFAKCPLQFFFRRVVSISEPFNEDDNLLPPDKAGTLVHDMLHHFYKVFIHEFPGCKVSDKVSEAKRILIQTHGYFMQKSESENYPRYLTRWLESFYDKSHGFSGILKQFFEYESGVSRPEEPIPQAPIAMEKSLKTTLPLSLGEFRLRGRIDRLDRDGDAIWVVDYKTGTQPSNKDVIGGKSLQLQTYALMLESEMPDILLKFCFYIFKPGGRKYHSNKLEKQEKTISQALENARILLPEMAKSISSGVFNRTFEDDMQKHCPYRNMCARLCSKSSSVPVGEKDIPESAFVRNRILELYRK